MQSYSNTDRAGLGIAYKNAATWGYFGAFVLFGLLTAALGPALPSLAEQTSSLLKDISIMFVARSLGYLLGSFFGGPLFDRLAGHRLMSVTLLAVAAAAALVPLVPRLWVLTAVGLILGSAEGALEVGCNMLLVWLHRERVGPYLNALHFFFGVGAFLSPIIIGQSLALTGGIRAGYWLLSLLVLPVMIWLARLPSPSAPSQVLGAQDQRTEWLLVGLVAGFFFLYVGAEAGYGGWVYSYAVRQLNLDSAGSAAYLNAAFWGSLTVGRLVSIPAALRYAPRTVLITTITGCLLSMGVLWAFSNSLAAVWLGTLGLGFSMAAVFPTTVSLAERRMAITGRVASWFFVGAGAGGMSIPWLVGQLFEPVGPRVTIYIITGSLILAAMVLAALLVRSHPPEPQKSGGQHAGG
jgi:FHS family Na+ dependent glucose MFS transporter 1